MARRTSSTSHEEQNINHVPKGSPHEESPPEQSSPDGGFFAWIQVVGCFFLYLNTWGIVSMYGVFQTYYETQLLRDRTPDDISWIGSLQIFLLFLGGTFLGPVFDMGYLAPQLSVGSFLICFGMFMTSICTKYWQIMLAQGVCMGLGFGCLFLPTIAVLSQYFTTRKAIAFGISSLGGSVGGIVFPILFRHLQSTYGFPWATRTIGFIMLATLIVPVVSMRQKADHQATKVQFVDFAAYKKGSLLAYVIGIFFGFCSIYIAQYYIQLYAVDETGIDTDLSFYLLPILNAATIPGRLISNYYADKLGFLNVQIPNAIGAAILCFCWIAIKNTGGIIVFAILYGFLIGSFNSLPGMTIVSLSPDLSKVGLQLGVSFLAAGVGCLVGPPIAGAILRSAGEWVGLQAWCGGLLVVFAIFVIASRLLEKGLVLRAKA